MVCVFLQTSRSGVETGRKTTTRTFLLLGSLLSAACATLSKETGCSAYLVCLAYDLMPVLKLERSGIILSLVIDHLTTITHK